jgi:PhzF family phenazine biosynthesis protein
VEILRYSAFSADPAGGNPAGVVLDATGVDDATMAAIAAEIGFSETAFVIPLGDNSFTVRYFSPLVEVPFCGHATIATAVAYAQRHGVGHLIFHTKAGGVTVSTETVGGAVLATLISVPPRSTMISETDLAELLAALGWSSDELNAGLPPRVAYAGAWHPIIAAADRGRLAELDYDMPTLADLMARRGWATINLIWRESTTLFHARNPFPPGGVVEDPATGAAAAALGGYLRELRLIPVPATITVRQGDDMGRPGTIIVAIATEEGSGIAVSGTAVEL